MDILYVGVVDTVTAKCQEMSIFLLGSKDFPVFICCLDHVSLLLRLV